MQGPPATYFFLFLPTTVATPERQDCKNPLSWRTHRPRLSACLPAQTVLVDTCLPTGVHLEGYNSSTAYPWLPANV
ncbi:hypothetical protein NDU88_003428, partial [Pleurodeles waltl]